MSGRSLLQFVVADDDVVSDVEHSGYRLQATRHGCR
jgi:hypothetical protein